jgi:UDP-glucuronate 4-epimerase
VTGAAGFIGSHLVSSLCADGHDVVGVDLLTDYYDVATKRRNLEAIADDRFLLIEGDLCVLDLDPVLEGIEHVYHLAGQPGVRSSWSDGFHAYVRNNVIATQRLLEACAARRVKRYVYASSSSVYGNAPTLPVTEDVLPEPISPYGVTKLAGEHLGRVYGSEMGLHNVAVRYFTVYGPRQRPDMALSRLITAALRGTSFAMFGDGSQQRDLTFVEDAVSATRLAAVAAVRSGSVFNVGGGVSCSLTDLIELVESETGRELAIDVSGAALGDARNTAADSSSARDELGWFPATGLVDGIAQHVDDIRRRLADHDARHG